SSTAHLIMASPRPCDRYRPLTRTASICARSAPCRARPEMKVSAPGPRTGRQAGSPVKPGTRPVHVPAKICHSGELGPAKTIGVPGQAGNTGRMHRMRRAALRVPEITVWFWAIKALSTALGESTSDYLVHRINPVAAVLLGFCGFVIALALQFSRHRYVAWAYWLAVVM